MSREWKPGDVGVATFDHGGTGRVFRVFAAPSNWCDMAGVCAPEGQIEDVRPLVTIDPEDREQVERLLGLHLKQDGATPQGVDNMQAALRSLIEPPKPEEPTGLGAVVEDAGGRRWIRQGDERLGSPWYRRNSPGMPQHRAWHEVAVVNVLSGGVTA